MNVIGAATKRRRRNLGRRPYRCGDERDRRGNRGWSQITVGMGRYGLPLKFLY